MVQAGLKDMELLVSYLEALDVIEKVSFDLSLARGLDYYTGVIFEVLMKPPRGQNGSAKERKSDNSLSSQVGSIAAGGR